jgi:hypothetical protein
LCTLLAPHRQAMLLKMKVVDKFISRYNLGTEMAHRLKQSTRLQVGQRL